MNELLAGATALTLAFFVPRGSAKSNFIFVANTGENTVSEIDVTVPAEVARYATWFGTAYNPTPSRIARDSNDNAYVLDRFFRQQIPAGAAPSSPPAGHFPGLLKIAPTGGTPYGRWTQTARYTTSDRALSLGGSL